MRALAMLILVALLAPAPARAQADGMPGRFRGAIEMGYGRLDRSFEGAPTRKSGTFSLGFTLGAMVLPRLMAGLELKGWLLEAYDFHDPTQGESVSEFVPVLRTYPLRASGPFVEAGGGLASYTNRHPLGNDGSGWGGTVGLGWDVHVAEHHGFVPAVHYSWGHVGDVENVLTTIRGRRFGVIGATVGIGFAS